MAHKPIKKYSVASIVGLVEDEKFDEFDEVSDLEM